MLKTVVAVSALVLLIGLPSWGLVRLGVPIWAAVCFAPGFALGIVLVLFGLVVALRRLIFGSNPAPAPAAPRS